MHKIIIVITVFILSCSGNGDSKKISNIQEKESKTEKPLTPDKIVETQKSFASNLTPKIVGEIDHKYNSYTQGLFFHNYSLYESTGEYTKSKLFKINPSNGNIEKEKKLPIMFFGEGSTLINDKIFVLTWKSGICLVLDKNSFNEIKRFEYEGEGWGITNDENNIYMSNGSNQIILRDFNSFLEVGRLSVYDENGVPYNFLNELEFISGEIWANVWMQDVILRIDPRNGDIIQKIDLAFLKPLLEDNPQAEVLNGIAYDSETEVFYLTGKNWNKIFKLKFN